MYAGELHHCLSEWSLTDMSISPTAMNTLFNQMYCTDLAKLFRKVR
jgi:hypothetical protein